MLDSIYQGVLQGKADQVVEAVNQALGANVDPGRILKQYMIAAMTEIGGRFEAGEAYVPEMLVAARAMQAGLAVLRPHLVEADIQPIAKVVLGTVLGDLHDIGKNLVGMMLEGAGFEVIDLGSDISPERFVQAVQDQAPRFVGMSALLTTTMTNMQKVVQALQAAGLRDQVIIMVGGAPLTQQFAEDIGADLYAADAVSAVAGAKERISADPLSAER